MDRKTDLHINRYYIENFAMRIPKEHPIHTEAQEAIELIDAVGDDAFELSCEVRERVHNVYMVEKTRQDAMDDYAIAAREYTTLFYEFDKARYALEDAKKRLIEAVGTEEASKHFRNIIHK